MNVLITGGFGYLGGRLAQFFASQSDYKVFLGSRQHRESPTWLPKVNVVQMVWNSKEELTGPINLGNPGEFTIRELAEKVIKMAGSNSKIIFEPLPEDDPTQRQPDIPQATAELGWEPKWSLETALRKVAEWQKAWQAGEDVREKCMEQIAQYVAKEVEL